MDKYPVHIEGFDGEYIEGDMFDFLAKTEEKFGVVTMIGMDYVLEHRRSWMLAWNGIQKITRENSVIVMFPEQQFEVPFEGYRVLSNEGCLIAQRIE